MDIKEIALKVADSLRNKIDGISHMQSNQGLVAFAEALITEIAKQDEPEKVKFFGWLGTSGELRQIRANESWPNQYGLIRIPELDCEFTLP